MGIQFPSPAPQFQPEASDLGTAKTGKQDAEPIIVSSEKVEKREPIVSLPPMPKPIPPNTKESEALVEVGDKILEMGAVSKTEKAEVERESLSEKIEDHVEGGMISGEMVSSTLEGISFREHLRELTEADLGLAAACFEGAVSLGGIGMLGVQIVEQNKIAKEAQEKLDSKQKELSQLTNELKKESDQSKIPTLEKTITELNSDIEKIKHTITVAEEKKDQLTQNILFNTIKTAVTGIAEGSEFAEKLHTAGETARHVIPEAAKGASHTIQVLPAVAATSASVLSVVTIALASKAINDNREIAEKILKEKGFVQQELEQAKGDPVMTELLQLRLQNLDHQFEENAISTVKNALSLTAGVLGTAVAAKTIALAVGATVGAALGTAVAATGVGAIVLGTGALLIGAGYLVYKNRHAIENKLQNVDISRKEFFDEKSIKSLQQEKAELRESYETSKVELKATKDFEATPEGETSSKDKVDDFYREKIDDVQSQIGKLKEEKAQLEKMETNILTKIPTFVRISLLGSQIDDLNNKIKELVTEKTNIAIGRGQAQKRAFTVTQKSFEGMQKTDRKILSEAEELRELNTKRNEINDAYKYGKDVAKFGKGADGEEMTWKKLKAAHERLYHGTNAGSLAKMQQYFVDQNKRVKTDVDVSGLKQGVNSEQYWEYVMKGISAPVK